LELSQSLDLLFFLLLDTFLLSSKFSFFLCFLFKICYNLLFFFFLFLFTLLNNHSGISIGFEYLIIHLLLLLLLSLQLTI